jgi:Family of unknown function (DUF5990)
MAKYELPLRVTVVEPPADVVMQVQRGRDELLPPSSRKSNAISFDFSVDVDLSSGAPNFLGKFAQGPKDSRFVYVNSGTYAGQSGTCWSRRAKISLMNITTEQVRKILKSPKSKLEICIDGTGSDGGPVCGSIRSPRESWKIIKV